MDSSLPILVATAASLGIIHTLVGPDHYLPFIVIGRARRWSLARTALLTFLCGLGHVGSSIAIGALGIGLGVVISRIQAIEGMRGNLAGWALTIFGAGYAIWGLVRALKPRGHAHTHMHADGTAHEHGHDHESAHGHKHAQDKQMTAWMLFIIFVLGPCEPLIPLLMFPAARHSLWGIVIVCVVFAAATIITMISAVILLSLGIDLIPMQKIERYMHFLAGMAILLSGLAIQFLGL